MTAFETRLLQAVGTAWTRDDEVAIRVFQSRTLLQPARVALNKLTARGFLKRLEAPNCRWYKRIQ